ncbi:FkbM family methyltransferase [Pseudobutyrivibrio xylanivorans]|uniref:Methyltransferase, FkbM family n=1 Tax=Pseudobutyrivibrio xylanivorans TaxID=185007 RepID=A0A1G5RQ25_PSEXY|nr:FkbM family methyltransferase [Pseudobutyrivibrio xylanivorans]SCZ76107.1 methyltransferase, FkbM family [Pseudobutyrivibrio xylanivorans]
MNANWLEKIKSVLMDDESERIFDLRVLYGDTLDEKYLAQLGDAFRNKVCQSEEWRKFTDKINTCDGDLVLYGAGIYGAQLLELTPYVKWKSIIAKEVSRESLHSVPIVQIDKYFSDYQGDYIVITSKRYKEEMQEYLLAKGVDDGNIIDGTILYDLTEGRQYFDLEDLPHLDGQEVFADVGSCDGMSAVQFLKWCNGNGYAYCFEPDEKNIKGLEANMKAKCITSEQYEVIRKGAWNMDGTVYFDAKGTAGSCICEDVESDKGSVESIEVTSLDNVFLDKKVTFIKMDIEGAELKALEGAQRIIAEQKPKLAICVYHKPEDILEIPMYILELNRDYKFYLRHYSFEGLETVLYAV